jgi:dihydroorotase
VGLALRLYHEGILSLSQIVAKYTVYPASILGVPHGTLRVGSNADVTILDPDYTYEVEATTLRSRSKNSPFLGWRLRGAAVATLVSGEVIFERL